MILVLPPSILCSGYIIGRQSPLLRRHYHHPACHCILLLLPVDLAVQSPTDVCQRTEKKRHFTITPRVLRIYLEMTLTSKCISQIDRLLAIWQATHPDSWFDGKQGEEDATNPLVPFTFDKKAGKDGSWTSMSVKDTAVFGYTYPDVEVGKSAKEVTDSYVQNYNWTTNNRRGTPPPQNMNPVAVFEKAQVFQYDPTTKDTLRAESERTGALDQALAEADRKTPASQVAQITISQPIAKQQTLLARSVMPETPIVENRVLPEFAASDLAITDPKEIEEKDVQRTWFVDNVVER